MFFGRLAFVANVTLRRHEAPFWAEETGCACLQCTMFCMARGSYVDACINNHTRGLCLDFQRYINGLGTRKVLTSCSWRSFAKKRFVWLPRYWALQCWLWQCKFEDVVSRSVSRFLSETFLVQFHRVSLLHDSNELKKKLSERLLEFADLFVVCSFKEKFPSWNLPQVFLFFLGLETSNREQETQGIPRKQTIHSSRQEKDINGCWYFDVWRKSISF